MATIVLQINAQMKYDRPFAGTPYTFNLVGITESDNASWYTAGPDTDAEREMKAELRKGGAGTLIIYSSSPGGGLLDLGNLPKQDSCDTALMTASLFTNPNHATALQAINPGRRPKHFG